MKSRTRKELLQKIIILHNQIKHNQRPCGIFSPEFNRGDFSYYCGVSDTKEEFLHLLEKIIEEES